MFAKCKFYECIAEYSHCCAIAGKSRKEGMGYIRLRKGNVSQKHVIVDKDDNSMPTCRLGDGTLTLVFKPFSG